MTRTEPETVGMTAAPQGDENTMRSRILFVVILIGLIFATGMIAGLIAAMVEYGLTLKRGAILTVTLLVTAGLLVVASRLWKTMRFDAVGPKTRAARNLIIMSGLTGGALGATFSLSTMGQNDPLAFVSNSPVPPLVAMIGTLIYAISIPLYSVYWWKSIDEHEVRSYSLAAAFALSLYSILMPSWWMLWRGGWVSEPNDMLIFAITITAWGLGWMWNRNR